MSGPIAILCSGQGAQDSRMFDLFYDAPEAAPVFAAARARLDGTDPRDLIRTDSAHEIHSNRLGQLLVCTQALAAWAVIRKHVNGPLVVAGYSVGELAAWGIAGLLPIEAVIDLALRRAAAMDGATTEPSGLLAVRGLARNSVEAICRRHGTYIAIVNASDQILVGGLRPALDIVAIDAQIAGAARTTLLPVHVASHTPLLKEASDLFHADLLKVQMASEMPPDTRLLSGVDGDTVFDILAGAEKLARQIKQTIEWSSCMETCQAAGFNTAIELGPGSSLVHMMHQSTPGIEAHSTAEFHSRNGLLKWCDRVTG